MRSALIRETCGFALWMVIMGCGNAESLVRDLALHIYILYSDGSLERTAEEQQGQNIALVINCANICSSTFDLSSVLVSFESLLICGDGDTM